MALLWEKDGTVTDLGRLGGAGGIAGNHGCAVNNQGEAVRHSELPNNATFHGFLWTRRTGMQDSSALLEPVFDASFNPGAFLWQNADDGTRHTRPR